MLGEKIAEFTGKTTAIRCANTLNVNVGTPSLEWSFQQNGKFFGTEAWENGTFNATPVNGTNGYQTEGCGILTMKDGEIVTWNSFGTARPTGKGNGLAWRGSIRYTTNSAKWQNKLAGFTFVYEYDTDETNTNVTSRCAEWK
jgi:hypothetical protein